MIMMIIMIIMMIILSFRNRVAFCYFQREYGGSILADTGLIKTTTIITKQTNRNVLFYKLVKHNAAFRGHDQYFLEKHQGNHTGKS